MFKASPIKNLTKKLFPKKGSGTQKDPYVLDDDSMGVSPQQVLDSDEEAEVLQPKSVLAPQTSAHFTNFGTSTFEPISVA